MTPESAPCPIYALPDEASAAAEAVLLVRARGGDRDAFAALCERSRRRIWRVVTSVTRGGADSEDLAQEAILRALRSLSSFNGDSPAAFDAWICRIALNAAHDYQKSAWRRRVRFWNGKASGDDWDFDALDRKSGSHAPGAHEEVERRALQRRIRAAVAGLGDEERSPIYLIYFEEFRTAEVARLEGVPESTIRSRVKRGLRRLERVLGDLRLPADDQEPDDAGGGSESAGNDRPASYSPATDRVAAYRSAVPREITA